MTTHSSLRALQCYGGQAPVTRRSGKRELRITRRLACNRHLADAVHAAATAAQPGEVVLLSPACASFDEFKNFEHRGDVFRELVAELAAGTG